MLHTLFGLMMLVYFCQGQKIKVYANLTADRRKELFQNGHDEYYFGINNSGLSRIPLGQQSFNHLVFVPWNGCQCATAIQFTGAGEDGWNWTENDGAWTTTVKNVSSSSDPRMDCRVSFDLYIWGQPWIMYIGYHFPPC